METKTTGDNHERKQTEKQQAETITGVSLERRNHQLALVIVGRYEASINCLFTHG